MSKYITSIKPAPFILETKINHPVFNAFVLPFYADKFKLYPDLFTLEDVKITRLFKSNFDLEVVYMCSKDIQVIVFDIDGTLYPLQGIAELNFYNATNFLSDKLKITTCEASEMLKANGILPYASKKNNSITQYILSLGFSSMCWNNYRLAHYPIEHIDVENSVNIEILYQLKKYYKLIALSSNMYAISCKILDKIGIDKNVFNNIFCLDKTPLQASTFSKKEVLSYISITMNIPYSSILSIGDRFSSDIEPILELGGKGALVSGPQDISEIADVLLGICPQKNNLRWDFYAK